MLKPLDSFLNSITMYKFVLYGLLLLLGVSITFSFFSLIIYSPLSLIASIAVLITTCYISNNFFSFLFKSPANPESWLITTLILFFIISPVKNLDEVVYLTFIAIVAIASKFIIAINFKHIFNPAAFAVFVIGLTGLTGASWWIAIPVLTIPVAVLGLLIVRKLRRFSMFLTFSAIAVAEMLIYGYLSNTPVFQTLNIALTALPIIFLGTIMLTEPQTAPSTKRFQIIYAFIVGLIFSSRVRFDLISPSPELALLAGNIFSYVVSSKQKLILKLKKRKKLSSTIYEFSFESSSKLNFKPGQFLEWTLDHKNSDSRGIRRYFTICSSPTENRILLGTRIEKKSSSYKKTLLDLKGGAKVIAGNLAGDFILPGKKNQRMVFLAGGIGITPFRSMIRWLFDLQEKRDIILIHVCSKNEDFVYSKFFDLAKDKIQIKIHRLIVRDNSEIKSKNSMEGQLTKLVRKNMTDFSGRKFYISGSKSFLDKTNSVLQHLQIKSSNIITDYFQGY